MFKPAIPGPLLGLMLLCSCAVDNAAGSPLPAEVPINPEAGRGGLLVVQLRLESGEALPFMVDTGSATCFDISAAPKLGAAVDTTTFQSWGRHTRVSVYAMPKLYLGGAPLKTEERTAAYDIMQVPAGLGGPIKGILGWDCLRHYCVQLDFAAGKMRFLDADKADKQNWGKAFRIVPLNSKDARPAVSLNLFGAEGPHSLIDSGYDCDGWLMPKYFQQWTNLAVRPAKGEPRSPNGLFGGEKYPLLSLRVEDVESDGIGLRFLARHMVTLDFPNQTLYLQRQSIGPLADPRQKTSRMKALDPLITEVLEEDADAARKALADLEQSRATDLEKAVARKLAATLENELKPIPADVPAGVTELPLGDARPEQAEVGWLQPAANRIPLNGEIVSPLLDSGKIYVTGLYAHSPSRYVFSLGGKWKALSGQAGLHSAFQGYAYGVVFVIKADGKEVFRSSVIRGRERPRYEVDVTGAKRLEFLVEQAGERNGGNWGLWLEPKLSRAAERNTAEHR